MLLTSVAFREGSTAPKAKNSSHCQACEIVTITSQNFSEVLRSSFPFSPKAVIASRLQQELKMCFFLLRQTSWAVASQPQLVVIHTEQGPLGLFKIKITVVGCIFRSTLERLLDVAARHTAKPDIADAQSPKQIQSHLAACQHCSLSPVVEQQIQCSLNFLEGFYPPGLIK